MSALGFDPIKFQKFQHGMIDSNSLGQAFAIAPQKLMHKMDILFSQRIFSENPLTAILNQFGPIDDSLTGEEFEWDMKESAHRPSVCTGNLEPNNDTPGKYRQTFKLKLDQRWYLPGDILFAGTKNKKYQVRVQNDAESLGDGFVYEVRIMTDNNNLFIPKKCLEAGHQWAKLYSKYEEASTEAGSTIYPGSTSYRNSISKYKKKDGLTDLANETVLAMQLTDENGGKHLKWMSYAEVQFLKAWNRELERGAWYSTLTRTTPGANGRMVISGAGIDEQLDSSHVLKYNTLTWSILEDFMMSILYGRVAPGNRKIINIFGGEYALKILNSLAQEEMRKKGSVLNIEVVGSKTQSNLHPNAMRFGFQFTRIDMANNISINAMHLPVADDVTLHTEKDPVTGWPLNSMSLYGLDLATEEGKQNIKIMRKKDSFVYGVRVGLMNGNGSGPLKAHLGDFSESATRIEQGVCIVDPTRCFKIECARGA